MKLVPWTPIEADDVAAGAPDSAGLNLALRDNAVHCQQLIYDEDRHTAPTTAGHAHRGDESSNVGSAYPNMPNLVAELYASSRGQWKMHSGVTRSNAGFCFAAGGQWVSHIIGDWSRPSKSLSVFGGGTHLVASACMIASTTLTAGSMQIGLSTGGGGDEDEERSFVKGGRVDIPFSLLSTGWRRFWAVINTEDVEFTQSVRYTVQCRSSLMPVGATVQCNLFDLRVGRLLDYPVLGYVTDDVEISGFRFDGSGNKNWTAYGYAPTGGPPPPLDHAIMIDDAIQLGAR